MKDSCMLFEIQNTCGQRITHDYYNYRVHSLLHFNNNHTIFLRRIQDITQIVLKLKKHEFPINYVLRILIWILFSICVK